MYKAKCNIACGDKVWEIGKVYSKKDIEGLDINDFEVIGEEKAEIETTITTATAVEEKKTKKSKK